MSLPPEKGGGTLNEGVIMIEVDDILEGGWTPRHKTLMDKFYKRFVCGQKLVLMDTPGGTRVSGIRVQQHSDYSFTYDMNE